MSCAWTNKVGCEEQCIVYSYHSSIFLKNSWNPNHVYNNDILQDINTLLDDHGTLSVVMWWYFSGLSPDQVEGVFDIDISNGLKISTDNITTLTGGVSIVHNAYIQSWATIEKTNPGEIFDFVLRPYLIGSMPTLEYAGYVVDIALYIGGYTPFNSGYELDPNTPAIIYPIGTIFEDLLYEDEWQVYSS